MRILFLCLLSVFPLHAKFALADIQIEEVGLKGYYTTATPTPVRIHLSPPQSHGPLYLEFKVAQQDFVPGMPLRVDRYSLHVEVPSDAASELDVPVPISGPDASKLDVSVTNAAGQSTGRSSLSLTSLHAVHRDLLLIICSNRLLCDETQSQVTFSGSAEDVTEKNRSIKFVTIDGPRKHRWDYSAAEYIVLVDPVSAWTANERQALEYYVRGGGTLILLEKEIADPNFLSPYRQGGGKINHAAVGKGKLYSISDLASKDMGLIFAGQSLAAIENARQRYGESPLGWLQGAVGVSFNFPRLRWLLIWLTVYILVIGVGNFVLLRRIKRLEWGWLTTSAIAVIFAVGLYMASSANRPKQLTLDNIVVYWMDGRSGAASEDVGLRVSSPERQQVTLTTDDNVLWKDQSVQYQPTTEIAAEITQKRRIQPGWNMELGPPFQISLPLLRWSYKDLNFETTHVFPGSVMLTADSHLKNDTGQYFKQALYFDFPHNKRYTIPVLAPDQEVDLDKIPSGNIHEDARAASTSGSTDARVVTVVVKNSGPSLLENISEYIAGNISQRVFFGLSDGPVPSANLPGHQFTQNNFALTVVSLDQP